MKEGRNAFKMLTGKPKGKRLSRRPRRRWEYNIINNLKGIDIKTNNYVDSAHDWGYRRALVNATSDLWVPLVMELGNDDDDNNNNNNNNNNNTY